MTKIEAIAKLRTEYSKNKNVELIKEGLKINLELFREGGLINPEQSHLFDEAAEILASNEKALTEEPGLFLGIGFDETNLFNRLNNWIILAKKLNVSFAEKLSPKK